MKLFSGLFDSNEKELKRLQPYVDEINDLEEAYERLGNDELRAKTAEFKERLREMTSGVQPRMDEARRDLEEAKQCLADAELDFARDEAEKQCRRAEDRILQVQKDLRKEEEDALLDLLPDAYAALREAAKRTLGLRAFDVQLIGAITLHLGKIAEMRTGEGKTLTATFPLYLNSLTGRGAHLVTVNDYLARRDPYWMGPVFHALGVSVASIYPMQNPDEMQPARIFDPEYKESPAPWPHYRPITRAEAYRADVTYGTSSEFGFDYLRDNMVVDLSRCVQRPLYYAIVDEVDNLLIDEARTPLIISAPDEQAGQMYSIFARLVTGLREGADYEILLKERTADLTEEGWEKVERLLHREGLLQSGDDLYSNSTLMLHLRNALSAKEFYKRDHQYVVDRSGGEAEIVIVDEFTGRKMLGRRYSEGLHQAIEAKEHVKVQEESKTYATITIQNYFRMYEKLGGMTGTAATEAEEFYKIYKLEVTEIPTNRPMVREDLTDQVYKTEAGKFRAVAREIKELHDQGLPVLVGTVSIEKSELLHDMLKRQGVDCKVLNAKEHTREAEIIAHAGEPGAVTVATNMAGRGVDIILGGAPLDYHPEEDIQEFIRRKIQEFIDKAEFVLKNNSGYEIWKKQYLDSLFSQRDEIQNLGDRIRNLYRDSEKSLGQIQEETQPLEARLKEITIEVTQKFLDFETQIENKLQEKYHELEKSSSTDIVQKIKNILGFRHKEDKLRQEIFELIEKHKALAAWRKTHDEVLAKGGLHIVGTERHEARRIDNQLRGRAGRQGDPGQSRFYVSLEDDIMRRFGGDRLKTVMGWVGIDEDTPIENKMITNAITDVQKRVEGYHFDVRKHLVEYDDVVNRHRELIYEERAKILGGADLRSNILRYVEEEIKTAFDERCAAAYAEDWDIAGLLADVNTIVPVPPAMTEASLRQLSKKELEGALVQLAHDEYARREKDIGPDKMRVLERLVMLQIIDRLWVEHLTTMERQRLQAQWAGLQQMKGEDAYKLIGHQMFEQELKPGIRHDVAHTIFKVRIAEQGARQPESPMVKAGVGSGARGSRKARATVGGKKVGRNDPCPCGSGKKYKHCCGK